MLLILKSSQTLLLDSSNWTSIYNCSWLVQNFSSVPLRKTHWN